VETDVKVKEQDEEHGIGEKDRDGREAAARV
jgi:hypothetical protein